MACKSMCSWPTREEKHGKSHVVTNPRGRLVVSTEGPLSLLLSPTATSRVEVCRAQRTGPVKGKGRASQAWHEGTCTFTIEIRSSRDEWKDQMEGFLKISEEF